MPQARSRRGRHNAEVGIIVLVPTSAQARPAPYLRDAPAVGGRSLHAGVEVARAQHLYPHIGRLRRLHTRGGWWRGKHSARATRPSEARRHRRQCCEIVWSASGLIRTRHAARRRSIVSAILSAISATEWRAVSKPARSGRMPLYSLTCSKVTPSRTGINVFLLGALLVPVRSRSGPRCTPGSEGRCRSALWRGPDPSGAPG